jgi:hypothetical protein
MPGHRPSISPTVFDSNLFILSSFNGAASIIIIIIIIIIITTIIVILPSSTYLFTVGVEVVYCHLITLRHIPQLVGFFWTMDRPVAETSTWQHTSTLQETNLHAPGVIRTHDPSKRSAADLRLSSLGHWDRHNNNNNNNNNTHKETWQNVCVQLHFNMHAKKQG